MQRLTTGREIAGGGAADSDFAARRGTLIRGRVRTAEGAPAAGATAFLSAAADGNPAATATTGADGAFALTASRSGRYTVGCRAADGRKGETEVDCAGGLAIVVFAVR